MQWLRWILLVISSSSVFAVEHLTLATTTSTDNSGLLAVLHPVFEDRYNIKIHVIAVGTGKALMLGSNGDVDVVFVHAPEAELNYVKKGDFIDRYAVMHNNFIIVGPQHDSIGMKQAHSAIEVLQLIADNTLSFISRGDDSGTHKKEQELWLSAGIKPEGEWYIKAGQGMGAVLKMADERQAYTLTDSGTQIAYINKVGLVVVYQGDKVLFNPYHVMAVNPDKHSHANYQLARKYIDFITSAQGQTIINNFRISGQQLFYPEWY